MVNHKIKWWVLLRLLGRTPCVRRRACRLVAGGLPDIWHPWRSKPVVRHQVTGNMPSRGSLFVTRFVGEHEQLTGKRIVTHMPFNENGKPVDAFTKVNRLTRQPDRINIVRRAHHDRDVTLAALT